MRLRTKGFRRGAPVMLAALVGWVGACGGGSSRETRGEVALATVQVVRPEVRLVRDGRSQAVDWTGRVAPGTTVKARSGRAWVRHDAGVRALVDRGAALRVDRDGLALLAGRAWVEAPVGAPSVLRLADAVVSASAAGFEVRLGPKGATLYVARGRIEVSVGGTRREVEAGDEAVVNGATLSVRPRELWSDWTGGLAWPAPETPAVPSGMGEVGARVPGSWGKASFPLATRRLTVKATVSQDLVTTVVDQVFFNPDSRDLEGVYRIRVPAGAILESFCIDRPGFPGLVCGFVKEKKAARHSYRKQVYVGSRDDPALLEWEAPGQYKAHLYPIRAGSTRRVVITYSEWLERDQDVRRWRYPMATAAGAGPRVQEFELVVNLVDSGAKRVEAAMGASVVNNRVVLRRSDFRPRADFELALHGGGVRGQARGYRSALPPENPLVKREGRYFMVRLRPRELHRAGRRSGLDLVVVVDLSADTDPSEIQLARTAVEALLRQLGQGDRVAVLGADLTVFDPAGKKPALRKVTADRVERILEGLSRHGVGGATDLGTVLSRAADLLAAGRGGAVVYVGDGVPTVGEMNARALRKRLRRRAVPVRLYGVAVGSEANLQLLASLAEHHGGLALRVDSRSASAAAALRIAGHASRPVVSRVQVDLGPAVERVFPNEPVSVVAGQDLVILGRLRGPVPSTVQLTGWYQGRRIEGAAGRYRVTTVDVTDRGRLRRRWGTARLGQLIAGGAGRQEVAELGTRFGLITEHTSIYVPSAREMRESGEVRDKSERAQKAFQQTLQDARRTERKRVESARGRGPSGRGEPAEAEGSAAASKPKVATRLRSARYSSAAKKEAERDSMAAPPMDEEADDNGVARGPAGKLDDRVKADRLGPPRAAPGPARNQPGSGSSSGRGMPGAIGSESSPRSSSTLALDGDASRARRGGAGKDARSWSGHGKGGGGGGGGGAGLGGSGFGVGKYKSRRPRVFMSRARVTGGLDAATVRRVVRRHLSEVRTCYLSAGLPSNPRLAGEVRVTWTLRPTGRVDRVRISSTTLNHPRTERCIRTAVRRWRFPKPEGARPYITYPFRFEPPRQARPASRTRIDIHVHLGPKDKAHRPKRCSAASTQPLRARRALWQERLRRKAGPAGVWEIWLDARHHCELHRWRDRRTLLGLMMRRLGTVRSMTRFATRHGRTLGWGTRAYLRRMIFAWIRTAKDLRLANRAFYPGEGLVWAEVEKMLGRLRSDAERIGQLHELAARYPRNVQVHLRLLDLLEKTRRYPAAERLCSTVVGNAWADARLRTAVGEYWARRGRTAQARRIFSEIVEFRPTDPLARRRLGDLYRAFGWWQEAYRQYQTLATLQPHDSSVLLLMALAAAGTGRVNEALRLEQRVIASSTGSGGAARWARFWAALQLAELRTAARKDKRHSTLEALHALARRMGVLRDTHRVRVFLTWNHPEAAIELWAARPGTRTPRFERADALGPQFGIEAVQLRRQPAGDTLVEIRRVARSRNRTLKATVWVIWDEGRPSERLVRRDLQLSPDTLRVRLTLRGRTLK